MMLMADDNANFHWEFEHGAEDDVFNFGDGDDEDDSLTIDIGTFYSILEETPNRSESMEKDQSTNDSSRGCTANGGTNNEISILGEGLRGSHTTGPHLVGQLAGSALSFPADDLDSSGSRSRGSSNVLDHADGNPDFSTQISSPAASCSESLKEWMPSATLLENCSEGHGVPQDTQSYAGFDDFQLQYQILTSSSGFSLDADASSGTRMENSNIDMGNQALGENSMEAQAIQDNQSSLSFDGLSENGTRFKQESGHFSDDMYESRDWFSRIPYNRNSNDSAFVDSSSHYSHGRSDIQHFLSNGETMGNVKDENRELLVDTVYTEGNILRGGYISGVSTSDYSDMNNSTCLDGDLITPFSGNSYSKPIDGTSVSYTAVHHLSPAQSNILSPKKEVCISADANNESHGSMTGTEEFGDVGITERGQKSLFSEDLSILGSRRDVKYSLNDEENTAFGFGRTHHSQHISDCIDIVDDGSFSVHDSLSSTFLVQRPGMSTKPSHCLKYESDCKHFQTQFMGSHHFRDSSESIKSNSSDKKTHVDDDADICILEEISKPVHYNPLPVARKVIIPSNHFASGDPLLNTGIGGMKHKPNDERLVYRVALQDLSQPKLEALPPEGVLAVPLLRHQRIALSWMVQKETGSLNCSGGILADDQGLGKTVSTISLILKERPLSSRNAQKSMPRAHLETLNLDDDGDEVMEVDGLTNPCMEAKGRPAAGTLVVCPTSVLRQWADELHSKVTKEADLSVLVYHGSSRTKDPNELAKYDVVLTTYSIVSMEVPKQPLVDKDDVKTTLDADVISPGGLSFGKKRKYPPSSDKRAPKSKRGLENSLLESAARPLARVGWFRVVLDEAQSIKNHRTQVARACWGLRAKRRWCLSGTPIQNSIDDLYSYFRFLRYDPYSGYKSFCSMIKNPISRSPSTGYRKLQAVLKTIMLRRTKGTLLDGEPIINLPPKTIELKKVEFSDEERDFYLKLEADSRKQFQVYAAAGTVKQNYVNILLMLLRLRQACDHPALIRGCDSTSMWRSSLESAKKLPREKQSFLLDKLGASLDLCSSCNDPPEDAVVSICGHVFCNQCICERLMGEDNKCPDTSCKVQLNTAAVFSKATLGSALGDQSVKDNSPGPSGSEIVETSGQSTDSSSFLSSKIKAALEVLLSMSKSESSSSEKSSSKSIDEISCCPQTSSSGQSEEVNTDISGEKSCILDKDRNSPVKDEDLNAPVKFKVEKAIVFSQWTRMLDLFESCLQSSSIQYRRLDGTMSVTARDKAVKDFNTLPEVTVMIMSLKAASLGLNMVAACHVLMLDLWWNPTTEDQAIDRAHRIGQTRPVKVLRLTVKDTVEDRILALQQKKREMVASAFGEDETGSHQTRLTVEDLQYLFEG